MMDYKMTPKAYARRWYADKIDGFVSIANELIVDGITDDTKLAHELHEWVNAPDSFFNWVGDEDEANEVTESILFISPNAYIAGQWESDDDSQMGYYAAHAFIADVMEKIGRGVGPYLGPDEDDHS